MALRKVSVVGLVTDADGLPVEGLGDDEPALIFALTAPMRDVDDKIVVARSPVVVPIPGGVLNVSLYSTEYVSIGHYPTTYPADGNYPATFVTEDYYPAVYVDTYPGVLVGTATDRGVAYQVTERFKGGTSYKIKVPLYGPHDLASLPRVA